MTSLADIWRENERNATERRCRIGMVHTQFALLPDPETGTIQPTQIAPTKRIDGVKLTIQPRLVYQYPFKREPINPHDHDPLWRKY